MAFFLTYIKFKQSFYVIIKRNVLNNQLYCIFQKKIISFIDTCHDIIYYRLSGSILKTKAHLKFG